MFDFDEIVERRGTHSAKWDEMEASFGVSADDGLPMWVADMDFKAPSEVNQALLDAAANGVNGYYGDDSRYKASVVNWMQKRHNWEVSPEWILTCAGLVQGTALCVQAYTQPDDGVILFTPVYHAFSRVIKANQRVVVESPLVENQGRYEMDIAGLEANLKGHEKLVILCSPHNPGGRVWSKEEIREVADFCHRQNLVLVVDEIHHDLVFPPHQHTVATLAAPEHEQNMVILAATTKTFNIASALTGAAIIPNTELREKFQFVLNAAGIGPNRIGMLMATAAYEHGEAWLEALVDYLDENRRLFDEGVNKIKGLKSMPLEATYLSWVDFSETGLTSAEVIGKVQSEAKIAANHGSSFGLGGEQFLRFNLATPRSRVIEAVARLQRTFASE
ncbi:pyridoxal phosphate-dependent aminotransferase [Vibrio sp. SCSIO 43140]|uniref:MalY/PatB family protein n=1 Tax=Vibrio sp. SCSIO 43140 TaxID=2819100 RepID=UPI0020756448|nr:MalY/PatB family protein [Vibrio sp. SCSIO 43140]USD63432.1 pyridoxal phosphate-dependent aminotransferase [Vibrio sp. SCSIO 43140]